MQVSRESSRECDRSHGLPPVAGPTDACGAEVESTWEHGPARGGPVDVDVDVRPYGLGAVPARLEVC